LEAAGEAFREICHYRSSDRIDLSCLLSAQALFISRQLWCTGKEVLQDLPSVTTRRMERDRYQQAQHAREQAGAGGSGVADYRMQRAVAAHMSNPNIGLFQALRVGGFEYQSDDDSTRLERDNLTLGQRKQELSELLQSSAAQLHLNALNASAPGSFNYQYAVQNRAARPSLDAQRTHQGAVSLNEWPLSGSMQLYQNSTSDALAASMAAQQNLFLNQASTAPGATGDPAAARSPYTTGQHQSSSFVQLENSGGFSAPQAYASVAISSLHATAQRNNLTLEQLAVVLSQKPNLAQFLMDRSDEEEKKKRKALAIFKTESVGLYRRCMLMAGFKAEECEEGSRAHTDFALEAWQAEGMRLQEASKRNIPGADAGAPSQASAGSAGASMNLFDFG
jgi:hypothetical protein